MKCFLIALLLSANANAGMNKCKDAEGNISYSMDQCENIEDSRTLVIHKELESSKKQREDTKKAKRSRLVAEMEYNKTKSVTNESIAKDKYNAIVLEHNRNVVNYKKAIMDSHIKNMNKPQTRNERIREKLNK